uniref:Uncharacterized protein n=1 Tax=uncultured marine virus TaxID=186617 RepID=A0A0F7L4D1_9VIRU|nr:hypothetical protein [uncultured marine virus]
MELIEHHQGVLITVIFDKHNFKHTPCQTIACLLVSLWRLPDNSLTQMLTLCVF